MTNSQVPAESAIPVTTDNFIRAETDMYFAVGVKMAEGIGKFHHYREVMSVDKQTVVRANRDTLYSAAVFDLDAGPAAITMPEAGKRFMSLFVIDQDEYVPFVFYAAGTHTITKKQIGTRYIMVGLRTFVNPNDPKDVEQVHALQDAVKVSQASSGAFEAPNWDQASQKKVRDALLVLGSTLPDLRKSFGTKEQVDPVRHLINPPQPGEAIPTKTPSISTSPHPKTMAPQSTSST